MNSGPATLQQLLDPLNSRHRAIRRAAVQAVRALSPDDLLHLVELESRNRRRRRKRHLMRYFAGAGLLSLALALVSFVLFLWMPVEQAAAPYEWAVRLALLGLSLFVGGGYVARWYQEHYRRARRELASLLENTDDLRFLVPMLQIQDREPSEGLSRALQRLLPRLRPAHVAGWTAEDRQALLLPLQWSLRDPDLVICCLKTLAHVGDETAIPALWSLDQFAYHASQNAVLKATRECICTLQANTAQDRQAKILLRASDGANTTPDRLLRAAVPTVDGSPPDRLLRPASADEC